MKVDIELSEPLLVTVTNKKNKRKKSPLGHFGFFICMNLCMVLAFFTSNIGGSKGIVNGSLVIWYFALPLIYLEAGLRCNCKALLAVLRDGFFLIFLLIFVYVLVPSLAKIGTHILDNAGVNRRLLMGIEVLHCLPPPLSTSLVLSRISNGDIAASLVATLVCHFGGIILSPLLLHTMLGTSLPPLNELNLREITYSALVPLAIGLGLRSLYIEKREKVLTSDLRKARVNWIPQALFILIAYNLFCDAFTIDAASMYAVDILLCVLIAFVGQTIIMCICWLFCCVWLSREVTHASVFACTFKSIGFGNWLIRAAFRNTVEVSAFNLPLGILTVAQLLLGSLVASWLAA
ncbi:hypothetical protein QAD02_024296 [Eretmocerus hayati]|uniref:Uncharacterized protein n=1 Tax=Eretmocerus hayati TaxID=131215 RepID=A0ACC2PZZ5_9HYME|nr:hypothetical protein QAD02_024296 [Eretmocerus hayati]